MPRDASDDQRIWRHAFVLSGGNRAQATRLLRRVTRRRPDYRSMDAAHVNRLVVLAAREPDRGGAGAQGSGGLLGPSDASFLLRAMELPRQSFEAWVFGELDELDLKDVSRAMDCSTSATRRHLERAVEELHEDALYDQRLASLRLALGRIDPIDILRRARGSERVRRRVRVWIVGLAILFAVLVVAREFVVRGITQ